jgi:exodeoxyribonuclease VII large subunit
LQAISVSSLNEQIKAVLDTTFTNVYVEGEISNLTYHNSGHIYFTLKDNKAAISCVMFRGNAQYLKFRLEVGQKVTLNASLTVYAPRGNYQLICTKVTPSGAGELSVAFEQLKAKLQIKGYFNKDIKKTIPRLPENIYIVTSSTGAAIEDMKKILSHRFPLAKMILIPTLVQGIGAKEDIARNISFADKLAQSSNKVSIVIAGRGGGSIEDLWAFNEEIVADAVYQCQTPIISAVGHESDVVISDFISDVRASTPSNAIEISTPDINEMRLYLDTVYDDFEKQFNYSLDRKRENLLNLRKLFSHHSFLRKFEYSQKAIDDLKQSFQRNFMQVLNMNTNKLETLKQSFHLQDPSKKDKSGFAQISIDNKVLSLNEVEVDEKIQLQNSQFNVECKVLSKKRM